MGLRVFISYATKDLPFVKQVDHRLSKSGCEVFVAERSVRPGQSLSRSIMAALVSADVVVLFWSGQAAKSLWVSQEIGAAHAREKTIVPVMLEPGLTLPGFIADRKHLPWHGDHQSVLRWLERDMAKRLEEKNRGEAIVGVVLLAGLVAAARQ